MKTLKKTLCLVLAVVMVVGVLIIPANAADYDDAAEIDPAYSEAVEVMSAIGILGGDKEANTFRPKDGLNRAEAAKIITYMIVGPETEQLGTGTIFDDVPTTHWANKYINYLALLQIVDPENDEYRPDDLVTGYEFGKMVLVALGYDPDEYTNNPAWVIHVTRDVKAISGSFSVKAADLTSAPIHRDAAAQLAFAGLTYTDSGVATGKYTVAKGDSAASGDATHWDDALLGMVFDSYADAVTTVKTLCSAAEYGATKDYTVVPDVDTTGSLGADNYGLAKIDGKDSFGRTSRTWEATMGTAAAADDAEVSFNKQAGLVKSYTTEATVAAVTADLKDYTINTGAAIIDGAAAVSGTTESDGFQVTTVAEIVALTGVGVTVELYDTNSDNNPATKVIDKIVVVNLKVGQVTGEGTTASPFKIGTVNVPATATVAKDQWVVYTQGKTDASAPADVIVDVYATEKLTGTLAQYTAGGVYTIAGGTYSVLKGLESAVQATLAQEKVFYICNGMIVKVDNVQGPETTIPTNYAVVLNAHAVATNSATWTDGAEAKNYEYTAEVQILTAEGTVAVYKLPVTKATGTVTGAAGSDTIGADDFYVTAGGKNIKLGTASAKENVVNEGTGTSADEGFKGKFTAKAYAYDVTDGVITLYDLSVGTDAPDASKIIITSLHNSEAIKYNSVTVKVDSKTTDDTGVDAIVNSNTKLIVKDGTQYAVTDKSTIQKVPDTGVTATNVNAAVVKVTKNGTGSTATYTYEVLYVFVKDGGYTKDVTPATDGSKYVYVDGESVVTSKEGTKTIYTFTVVNSDGTTSTMTSEAPVESTIYALTTDGKLGSKKDTDTKVGTVSYYEGNVLQIKTDATTTVSGGVVSGTVIVGDLKVGSTVVALIEDGSVTIVFVFD